MAAQRLTTKQTGMTDWSAETSPLLLMQLSPNLLLRNRTQGEVQMISGVKRQAKPGRVRRRSLIHQRTMMRTQGQVRVTVG